MRRLSSPNEDCFLTFRAYMTLTANCQAKPQATAPANSQITRIRTPHCLPTRWFTTPTIYGEGKSPNKCIKNTETALACALKSAETLFMTAIPTGPVLLYRDSQE